MNQDEKEAIVKYVQSHLSKALGDLEEAVDCAFELGQYEGLKLLEELENKLCGPGIFDFYSVAQMLNVWNNPAPTMVETTKDIGEVNG